MATIVFDSMCRNVLKCKNYIEWDFTEEIRNHDNHYESIIECVSCTVVGQSYNIEMYPDTCPHKKALNAYKKRQEGILKRFLIQKEKDKIWKKLMKLN